MAFASQVQMYVQPTLSAEIASLFLAGTFYFVLLLPCVSACSRRSYVYDIFFFASSSSLAFLESELSLPHSPARAEAQHFVVCGSEQTGPLPPFNASIQAQLAKSQQSLPLAWPPPRGITRSHSRGEQHSAVTRAASAPAVTPPPLAAGGTLLRVSPH